ncbi:MAG: undecaprenyl diphosphate synthase family protein [Candidatus Nanohaloarchaea archaeon]
MGIIPDGNRRYAESNGITQFRAYRKAKDTIKDVVSDFDGDRVREVTVYMLSEENFRRDESELENLFKLFKESQELFEKVGEAGFSVNWAATAPGKLPEDISQRLRELEEKYSEGKKKLNMLVAYSGKEDILESAREIAENSGEYTRENMKENLEIGSEIDFVVRTGDNPTRECLSGFPLWNASYAEYYHIQKNFPNITTEDVQDALDHYDRLRKKRGS